MEKLDRPVKKSWFGEGEIVDADLLVDLLDSYRFGKDNVPAKTIRSMASAVAAPSDTSTEMNGEHDDNGPQGNMSVHENTSSLSSNSYPTIPETGISETGSNNEPGSNEETNSNNESGSDEETGSNNESGSIQETNYNWLESKSRDFPNVETERQHNEEVNEIEVVEEDENREMLTLESDEKSNLETLLALQETSEEKSNLKNLLALQETYEIYCPSCSSSITKRLILKERKHENEVDFKPNVPVLDESCEIEEIEPPVKVQNKPDLERFTTVELLKSIVYGGITETIASLVVVASASASGSSTENILALAVANLAGGIIVLSQNLRDLRNNIVDQEDDRYEELLGRRANFRFHVLVAVLSYILYGLIPPLVYAFSFYKTGIKNYKLMSVFSVSLVCVVLLGMIKVYVRKTSKSTKPYLKTAVYYTAIVVASCGISYFVGDIVGEYIRKLGWFSVNQVGITSIFDGIKPEDYGFTSF
ncbi:unnamed protein product [Cochlearia groenlandica]